MNIMNIFRNRVDGPRVERVRHGVGLRSLTVENVVRLTPGMLRVVFSGTDLADFASLGLDDHVKLFVPTAASKRIDLDTATTGVAIFTATKNALRTATEALRQEAGRHLRVTEVSPGFVDTGFADASITDPEVREAISERKAEPAISPDAIVRAVAFAVDQPDDVEIGSIVVRPTARD